MTFGLNRKDQSITNKTEAVKFDDRAEHGIEVSCEGVTEISSALRESLADIFART